MNLFPIRRVDRSSAEAVETLGSKPKFWFDDKRYLFKADVRGTGEDWAEVISCELCRLLGLPHVEYELAAEYDGNEYLRPGVICGNMAISPVHLVLGNELLLSLDPKYPRQQRFKVRQHTVDAVTEMVGVMVEPSKEWMSTIPSGVQTALDIFSGYAMLDAWIANQDRHHENWGALISDVARLAPTFDHGAALARNLKDEEREERLTTKDRNRTIEAFVVRGRSAFYRLATDDRPLGMLEAFHAFAELTPAAKNSWLERLGQVNRDAVWAILERVPDDRLSEVGKRFTLELLLANQRRLLA
jgi:hypothetical protein